MGVGAIIGCLVVARGNGGDVTIVDPAAVVFFPRAIAATQGGVANDQVLAEAASRGDGMRMTARVGKGGTR